MSFLMPSPPKPPPAPNTPILANANGTAGDGSALAPAAASLINTSPQGLKTRASTQQTSLIGGG